jgi:ParB-like chromosome segregation protein Spo0J
MDRIIEPTKARIDAMAKSLSGPLGQIEPIMVARYLGSSWKIVTGATRLAAAKQLGWEQIEATVITADNDFEYQLIEITENLDRYDLSENERSKLRQQETILRVRREAHFEEMLTHPTVAQLPPNPSKKATGRPKGRPKGGVRDAARKAGIPKSTADRRAKRLFAPADVWVKKPNAQTEKCPTCGGTGQVPLRTNKMMIEEVDTNKHMIKEGDV